MGSQCLVGLALLCVAFGKKQQVECGVEIEYADGSPDDYESIGGRFSGVDLDDELCSLERSDQTGYKEVVLRECREREQSATETKPSHWAHDKDRCRWFGVSHWNRTCSKAVALMSGAIGSKLCDEDKALFGELRRGKHVQLEDEDTGTRVDPSRCNTQSPVCKKVNGRIRLVGFVGRLTESSAKILAQFPHLFSLHVNAVKGDLTGASLPDSLRVFHITGGLRELPAVAALLLRHGKVQSLQIEGGVRKPLDLSLFCGLDLHRFSAAVTTTGHIPDCWSEMKNLESFYCVNCRMTSPPTGLRGLQSLKSFVAFRQSEVSACDSKKIEAKGLGPCKPSWETRMNSPFSDAKGEAYERDPRFACVGMSYAFPFQEFLSLGWTNVEKVWLDGNFLTGEIPENIAEVWPSLQSLDLYDNSMHGEIPESLAKLDLVKLQMNGNNFSGTFPKGLAAKLKN